jgi:hypothetical protein
MGQIAKERFGMTAYYPRWQKHTIEQMMLEQRVLLLGDPGDSGALDPCGPALVAKVDRSLQEKMPVHP